MDDFRLEDLDNFDLLSAEKVANKYGGDKRKIGEAAQMGLINPTVAVMAGMFIDRMRNAAIKEQQPSSTVAQDVMAPTTQMAGLGATPQAQTASQMPRQAPTQMAAVPTGTRTLAEGGLAALPVDEDMFPDEYAGGGIVAFEGGGPTTPFGRSAIGRFAGSIGDYFSEQNEIANLRSQLKDEYETKASLLPGAFMAQPEGSMAASQKMLGDIYKMDINQLRQLAASKKISPSADLNRDFKDTDTDVDLSQIKKLATPAPTPKTEAKATEGVNVKAADKALTDYAKKVRDINKEFGVSDTPDAKAREALDKYKEKLNKDLDKAGALGLVSAGLGIAGGKSRYALQNLAGAAPAIEQYSRAMDKIREGEKGILDSEARMEQAADARARGNVKLALELEKDAKDLALKERQAAATERQALKPSQFAEQYSMYAADEKAAGRKPSFEGFRKALGSGDENIDLRQRTIAEQQFAQQKLFFGQIPGYNELKNAAKGGNPEAVKKLQEFELKQYNDILNRVRGSSPTAATGTVDANNPLLKGG